MFIAEVIIFVLMVLDSVMYIWVKKTLKEKLEVWVWVDLGIVILGLITFFFVYFKEESLFEKHYEIAVLVVRYTIQIGRLLLQCKR